MHVVGGQQHHLLLLREVVMEDAVQQALPLELPGQALSEGHGDPHSMPPWTRELRYPQVGQVVGMEQRDWDKCGAQADGGQGDRLAPGYSPWE